MQARLWRWLLLACLGYLSGCASNDLATPRMRIGALPFPGFATNYVLLDDPSALGQHRYERLPPLSSLADEVSSGIVYTRRGGFIDLAHVRSSIDWVRYIHDHVLAQLLTPAPAEAVPQPLRWTWLGNDFELELRPPDSWWALEPSVRTALAHGAAQRIGQRMAVSIGTWHEIGSWYGQMILPLISEQRSAFTWDDSYSHAWGAGVGAQALQRLQSHPKEGWNQAVTHVLRAALRELEPVTATCQAHVVSTVQNHWWAQVSPLKRDLDAGLDGQAKQPWRVDSVPCAAAANTPPFAPQLPVWPSPAYSSDLGLRWRVRLPDWLACEATNCSPQHPVRFEGEAALRQALLRLRETIRAEQGHAALQP